MKDILMTQESSGSETYFTALAGYQLWLKANESPQAAKDWLVEEGFDPAAYQVWLEADGTERTALVRSQIDEALEQETSPQHLSILRALRGWILDSLGQGDDAVAEFQQAIQLDPSLENAAMYADVRLDLSRIQARREDFAQSVEVLEEAIREFATVYDPSENHDEFERLNSEAALAYALNLPRLENASELARSYAQKALALNPENPDALLAMGLALAHDDISQLKVEISPDVRRQAITCFEKYLQVKKPPETADRHEMVTPTVMQSLQQLRSTESPQTQESSRCFVATAVYGDTDDPDVMLLRAFRDEVLVVSTTGRALTRFYYFVSPTLAAYIRADVVKLVVRVLLIRPMIWVARHKLGKLSS